MTHHARLAAGLAVLLAATPGDGHAQVRASELGSVSQVIDGTKVTITYSRPRVRGRDPVFGTKAVHWGETWTPGANWATTLELDKDARLNGRAVAKGKYSVWMVVRQAGDWTLVLDPEWRRFHMDPPDSSARQVRIAVKPEPAPFTEVLTWSVPEIRMNGGTIVMQWEKRRVPIDLAVQPSLVTTLPERDAAPFLGRYDVRYRMWEDPKKPFVLNVLYENGTLKAEWEPADPYFKRFALVRIAPDWFAPGVYDDHGDIYEVLRPDMIFQFTRAGGRAASVEMRDEADSLIAAGTRRGP